MGEFYFRTLFSLWQLSKHQWQPLFITFKDLTEAFTLVNSERLFKILSTTGYPTKLLKIVSSSHDGIKASIHFDGSVLKEFDIKKGVKQGCIMAPTLLRIFFVLLLKHISGLLDECINLHSRADAKLFNVSKLKARMENSKLYADDQALVSHLKAGLQYMMACFALAFNDFSLEISLMKTNVLGQGPNTSTFIMMKEHQLVNDHEFTYLGTMVMVNKSPNKEINR